MVRLNKIYADLIILRFTANIFVGDPRHNSGLKGFYRNNIPFYNYPWINRSIHGHIDSTHFEPNYAMKVFPCFDQPDMKGKWVV